MPATVELLTAAQHDQTNKHGLVSAGLLSGIAFWIHTYLMEVWITLRASRLGDLKSKVHACLLFKELPKATTVEGSCKTLIS